MFPFDKDFPAEFKQRGKQVVSQGPVMFWGKPIVCHVEPVTHTMGVALLNKLES